MEVDAQEWGRFKGILERIDSNVNGNGKEPLEIRLKKYIDQRDSHKERNAQQSLTDCENRLVEKIDENKEASDEKVTAMHKANTERQDKFDDKLSRVERLVYIGFGIVITLDALGLFKR